MVYLVDPKETAFNAKCISRFIVPLYGVPPVYCWDVQ